MEKKYYYFEEDGQKFRMSRGGLVFVFRVGYDQNESPTWYKTGQYNVPTSIAEKIFEATDE